MANIKIMPPTLQSTGIAKAGRKRRANGQIKSEVSLNFRDSMYSEKAAAMIESKSEGPFSASSSNSTPTDELAAGAFQFVDQSASSRREARRFVMRRSVWHRKQEQTKRINSPSNLHARPNGLPPALRSKSNSMSEASSPSSEKDTLDDLPPRLTLDTRSRSILPFDPVRSCSTASEANSSPQTAPSTTSRDTFESSDYFPQRKAYGTMSGYYGSPDGRHRQQLLTSGWR